MHSTFKVYKMKVKEILLEISDHIRSYAETSLNEAQLEQSICLILKADKIFIYGAGRSGFTGRCLAQRLMHVGLNAYYVGETITPPMRRGDVLICVSGSGMTTSTLAIAEAAKKTGVSVIGVTSHVESRLGEIANAILHVRGKTKLLEYESLAPFTSLFDVTTLTLFDGLVSEIMYRLGVTENGILESHATIE